MVRNNNIIIIIKHTAGLSLCVLLQCVSEQMAFSFALIHVSDNTLC